MRQYETTDWLDDATFHRAVRRARRLFLAYFIGVAALGLALLGGLVFVAYKILVHLGIV